MKKRIEKIDTEKKKKKGGQHKPKKKFLLFI